MPKEPRTKTIERCEAIMALFEHVENPVSMQWIMARLRMSKPETLAGFVKPEQVLATAITKLVSQGKLINPTKGEIMISRTGREIMKTSMARAVEEAVTAQRSEEEKFNALSGWTDELILKLSTEMPPLKVLHSILPMNDSVLEYKPTQEDLEGHYLASFRLLYDKPTKFIPTAELKDFSTEELQLELEHRKQEALLRRQEANAQTKKLASRKKIAVIGPTPKQFGDRQPAWMKLLGENVELSYLDATKERKTSCRFDVLILVTAMASKACGVVSSAVNAAVKTVNVRQLSEVTAAIVEANASFAE